MVDQWGMVVRKSMMAGSKVVDCLAAVQTVAAVVVAKEVVGSCDTPSIMRVLSHIVVLKIERSQWLSVTRL